MPQRPAVQISTEALGTALLLTTVLGSGIMAEQLAHGNTAIATGAAYITSAYWFTASTAFANPAVTLARALTDTFSGIRPSDVAFFIMAQLLGALAAWAYYCWAIDTVSQEKN